VFRPGVSSHHADDADGDETNIRKPTAATFHLSFTEPQLTSCVPACCTISANA
jgi:hypothetical protein